MARFTHKATDGLSAECQRALVAGFRAKLTYAEVTRQLRGLGAEISERAVARAGAEWREEEDRRQAACEQMRALIGAMKAEDMNAAEIVHALGVQALLDDPEEGRKRDPLEAEKLRIQRETLEVRKRQVELAEKKLAAMVEREARAAAVVADEDEKITPEERVRRIREIYGIREPGGAG